MHTTDILIRSYRGDFGWLAYALKSLHANSSGFRHIHVVVPQGDGHLLAALTQETVHECPAYGDDYLGQQITKMMSDAYSGADYIMCWDSDTMLVSKMSPLDLIIDGKPIVYYDRYETLQTPWQPIVAEVLGWVPEFEFMRRHPFVYPRWLFREVREYLENRHGVSLESYIIGRPFRSFSEFNVLGAYAWQFHPDKFTWLNPSGGPTYVRQFRSWDGLENNIVEVEQLLQ